MVVKKKDQPDKKKEKLLQSRKEEGNK